MGKIFPRRVLLFELMHIVLSDHVLLCTDNRIVIAYMLRENANEALVNKNKLSKLNRSNSLQ